MAGRAQELTEHISSLSHLAGPAARRAERIQEDSDRGPIGIGWSRTRRSNVAGLRECRADGLERDGEHASPWAVEGAGIWRAAGVIAGFEAPVVTGSDDLHSNDI